MVKWLTEKVRISAGENAVLKKRELELMLVVVKLPDARKKFNGGNFGV
jgi:hypothetical protein